MVKEKFLQTTIGLVMVAIVYVALYFFSSFIGACLYQNWDAGYSFGGICCSFLNVFILFHYFVGSTAFFFGFPKLSIAILEFYVYLFPLLTYSYLRLSFAFLVAKKPEKCKAVCDDLLSFSPSNILGIQTKANACLLLYQTEEALDTVQKGLDADPQNKLLCPTLAACYYQKFDFEKSMVNAKKCLEHHKSHLNFYLQMLALLHLQTHKYNECIEACNEGIQKFDSEVFLQIRAICNYRMGNTENGLQDLNEIIEKKVNGVPNARFIRGSIYCLLGRIVEAKNDFQFIENQSNRGINFGQILDSAKTLSFAKKMGPVFYIDIAYQTQIEPLKKLGSSQILFLERKYSEALSELESEMKVKAWMPYLLTYRGLIKARLGEPNEAIKDFSKAIEINNYNVDALWLRSRVYEDVGEIEKAEADKAEVAKFHYIPHVDIVENSKILNQ